MWDTNERPTFNIESMNEYNEVASGIESCLQKLLEEHNYNTVGNFISLYEGFKRSLCTSLVEFFQSYVPPITSKHHTCVGLALELWSKLYVMNEAYPGFTNHLYIVSCEEGIGDYNDYPGLYGNIEEVGSMLEKEHVLLAFKFEVNGRQGIMLCDPGYHVGRVITVMKDEKHPHTGWFTISMEQNALKEYNYNYCEGKSNFIEWFDRTTRPNKVDEIHSLIYIKKPYLTAVDVTERRNLVYTFRSLLSRDQKGHIIAGIYFKVKENCDEFTIFYQDDGKQKIKLNFSQFTNIERVNERILNIVRKCSSQLNLKRDELLSTLHLLSDIINDKNYISQILDINNCINIMADVN